MMDSRVPSLTKVCVSKIVKEIKLFCRGVDFDQLGKQWLIPGPLENLSSSCIETIFNYVICTKQLNQAWLAVLIVSHLKAIDFTYCPSVIDKDVFNTLMQRCQHLEKLLIPNCKKIPNASLCELLTSNTSLLALDISNKLTPSIDRPVMTTIVHSCRCLRVLKLSDYRLEDPKTLLVLCGRVAVSRPEHSAHATGSNSASHLPSCVGKKVNGQQSLLNSDSKGEMVENDELMERVTNMLVLDEMSGQNCACGAAQQQSDDSVTVGGAGVCNVRNAITKYMTAQSNDSDASVSSNMENAVSRWVEDEGDHSLTWEEEENRAAQPDDSEADKNQDVGSDYEEDLYEDDSVVCPLEVEDCSNEFGCLELETLWLENINLTDQVAAVLMGTLLHLRDINLSDTDICNPWRLLDNSQSVHLRYLADLDVKSTALSRTALQMIPKFHPDLQKLSISSTTLPPPTYTHIAKLSGIAELELIGGQFYPCEPEEIFTDGIFPAVSGVGEHLQSLNLTYFAHVEFSKVILSCPAIRHLDLSRTDIFVTFPCPSVGKHCPNLTSLNLGYAHIEAMDDSMQLIPEDKVTCQMIGEPPVLEELHLCGLTVSDEGIRTMYPGVEYPLTFLDVSRCKMLTIAGIQHLWKKCPFLRCIDMTHCKEIALADYKAFDEECKETRPIFKLEGTVEWK